MPYLGNNPTANFASVTKDTFSGNASTTAFTLSKPATTNGVAVYVENVRQIPTTAYAISGTTLTFTAAPPSGTNNIYVMHHNTPVSTATHPAAQDLTCAGFTSTGIDDNADATTMTIDTSERIGVGTTTMNRQVVLNNNSLACLQLTNSTTGVAAGAGSQFQQSGNNGYIGNYSGSFTLFTGASGTAAQVIDANGHVTMPLQPCFHVSGSRQNNVPKNATTDITFNSERFDVNGDFDTSNYTFTAPVTGKYQINIVLRYDNGDMDNSYYSLYLVTSNATYRPCIHTQLSWDQDPDYFNMNGALVVDMDAGDTAKVRLGIPNLGADQVDLELPESIFSGYLVA